MTALRPLARRRRRRDLVSRALSTGPEALATYTGDKWDPRAMLHGAELARAAYAPADDFRRLVRAAGYTDGKLISAGAAQAGVCWSDEHDLVAIAPRGTKGLWDMWHDALSAVPSHWRFLDHYDTARIGRGFRIQTEALLAEVEPVVEEIFNRRPAKVRIKIQGHSLGAGLAETLGWALHASGYPVDLVLCFSSPRVGNREWIEATKDGPPVWHVVNTTRGPGGLPVLDWIARVLLKRRTLLWPEGTRHRHEVPDAARLAILTDEGPLFGSDDFLRYRQAHPTTRWQALRILTRFRAARTAHGLDGTIDRLRAGQ